MWISVVSHTVTAAQAAAPVPLPVSTAALVWLQVNYTVAVGYVFNPVSGLFEVPPVPQTITSFQGKAALLRLPGKVAPATLLDDVTAVVAAAAVANPIVQLAFDAGNWTRTSPLILSLSATLGLTSAQLDALFVSAFAIEV